MVESRNVDVDQSLCSNMTNEILFVTAQKCHLATVLSKRQQKRVVVPKLPTGVRDIDANVTDPFLEPTYAEDVIRYLRTQERKFRLPTNHLDGNAITSHMRRVLVDWLLQVQVNYISQVSQVTFNITL